MTPDSGFVIDRSASHPAVIIASACSGHGFKHSAALGEAIAESIVEGRSHLDLTPFARYRDSAKTFALHEQADAFYQAGRVEVT